MYGTICTKSTSVVNQDIQWLTDQVIIQLRILNIYLRYQWFGGLLQYGVPTTNSIKSCPAELISRNIKLGKPDWGVLFFVSTILKSTCFRKLPRLESLYCGLPCRFCVICYGKWLVITIVLPTTRCQCWARLVPMVTTHKHSWIICWFWCPFYASGKIYWKPNWC